MAEPSFPPGIHVPALTFFHDDTRQDIDWETQEKHLDFLVRSGLHGIVTAGTNGEAISLTTDEKCELIRRTKAIAAKAGRLDLPVTAGCSAGCTRDVIDLTIKSKEAGADFALILVSSFFHFALDESAIVSFFQDVADASPLPIVLYNFPGVVAGLDISSDMVDVLGRHPNIAAAKFTCGSVAKLTRVAASFLPSQCTALAGQMEWLVPALVVGGQGAIAGFANLFPRICVELFNLQRSGKADEARKLQQKVAVADLGMGKGGINGTKWVVCKLLGYPDSSTACRKPYPLFTEEKKQEMIIAKMRPLEGIEANLGRHSELSNGTAVKVVLG